MSLYLDDTVQDLWGRLGRIIVDTECTSSCHQLETVVRPPLVVRIWFPTLTLASGLLFITSALSLKDIQSHLTSSIHQTWETFQGFLNEWILKPCQDMLATIRHKEAKLAIMGSGSLHSDLEVLFIDQVFGAHGD